MAFYREHIYTHLVRLLGDPKPIRDLAHERLAAAVAAAYHWPPDLPDDEIRSRLLALNLERATNAE